MPQHAVAVIAGALLALYGNQLPDLLWTAYLPLLVLLCRYCPAYRFLLLAAAAHLWSAALFHYHLEHRLIGAYDNRVVVLRGSVDDIPVVEPGRIGFYLEDPEIEGYPAPSPRRIRLAWYQDGVVPRPGEYWQLAVKLRQPRGSRNPAGFDYAAWQFAAGVDAGGYVRDSPANRRLDAADPLNPHYWRMQLARALDAYCADCSRIGLIKALALGFRGEIPRRQRRVLQHSGTAHLLAISGLHVGLVAVLAYGIGGLVWRSGCYRGAINRPRLAALFAMLAATGYAAMAGFSLPTLRALVMLLAMLVALLIKNRVSLPQALALAVVVITLADPRALAASSFWLSVGALLVIAFVQYRQPGNAAWWRRLLLLQLYFGLLFAPLGLLIFERLTPASLPANLLAIPAISFLLLPLVLLGCLFAALGMPGARLLLTLADRGLGVLLEYLEWLLRQGLDAVPATFPVALVAILLACLFWQLMPPAVPGRRAALLATVLLLGWQPARLRHGEFELLVLDVGMGTSALVRTRNHSLVYDLGPGRPGGSSAAEWALLPAMLRYRIAPDLVVVSHVDQDHSGGLPAFLDRFPRAPLVSGTARELRHRFGLPEKIRSCHDWPAWRWDGIGFRFLAADRSPQTNNRSCVLMVDGSHRVLLPGDIESGREAFLVARYGGALAADVILVPHHGSDSSSSAEFLQRVAPGHAVFTLSRANRWGFPGAAVVERYRALGTRLLRTSRDGAVTISSSPRELRLTAQRDTPRRIWRRW